MDFVAVGALLTLLFLGVVQLTVVLHVRNTLTDCASEGARYGALADRTPADGARRTQELITESLAARYADAVTAGLTTTADGVEVVEVTVRAPLPVIGLLGVGESVVVSGHGAVEGR